MKPTIICLTPVKNEAWILDNFLKSASLWADHIIIADQMSTDGSREIAKKYPKVILIDNDAVEFNEPERQKLLIDEARKILGKRLLITLDADEMFSPDILKSEEWKKIKNLKPGTVIKFQWANLRKDFKTMWISEFFPWGYMDDGYEHKSQAKIHSARIPLPDNQQVMEVKELKVLHFQYANWTRMRSKHRWYQCYERISFPNKSELDIFRQYHHMLAIPENKILPIPEGWIDDYAKLGISIINDYSNQFNWFDQQVIDYFEIYGHDKFKHLHIWDIDWIEIAKFYNKSDPEKYKDPRSVKDKIIQRWLLVTQDKFNKKNYRRIDRLIKHYFHY